jgi:hypothetical protein
LVCLGAYKCYPYHQICLKETVEKESNKRACVLEGGGAGGRKKCTSQNRSEGYARRFPPQFGSGSGPIRPIHTAISETGQMDPPELKRMIENDHEFAI